MEEWRYNSTHLLGVGIKPLISESFFFDYFVHTYNFMCCMKRGLWLCRNVWGESAEENVHTEETKRTENISDSTQIFFW